MSLIERSKIVYICTFIAVVMFGYFMGYLIFSSDPRMSNNSLEVEEAYLWEIILLAIGLISTFTIFLSSLSHSFKTKRMRWRTLIIFIFPLSFVYAWIHGRKV
jgi:protein-S-isoprenylcysteine O-methyltransferase Ste14